MSTSVSTKIEPIQIDLAGIELGYVRTGGDGPTLLMLHGGGGPQHPLPFFEILRRDFDVIAPIHPGFGGTPIPETYDSLDDLIYLYLDLLDALDLDDVVLVGFSMGGWLAAELAVRSTARLARLVLVDPVGIKPGGPEDRDVADVFGIPTVKLAELLYHDPSVAPDLSKATDDQLAMAAANRTALAFYTWEPYMHNPKLAGRLHRVTVPTLLIWGESDGLVSVDYGRAYQALIPGADLVVLPDAGHAPQLEQPDQFVKTMKSFLL